MSMIDELEKQLRELRKKGEEQERLDLEEAVKPYMKRSFVVSRPSRNLDTVRVDHGLIRLQSFKQDKGKNLTVGVSIKYVDFAVSRSDHNPFVRNGLYTRTDTRSFWLSGWKSFISELGDEVSSSVFDRVFRTVDDLGLLASQELWEKHGLETLEQNAGLVASESRNSLVCKKKTALDIPHIQLVGGDSSYLGGNSNIFIHGDLYLISRGSLELAEEHLIRKSGFGLNLATTNLLDGEYGYLERRSSDVKSLRARLQEAGKQLNKD